MTPFLSRRDREVAVRLRVVIADDERPARAFLRDMLASAEDVEIVGEATNGAEAIEMIERLQPDLALLDLQMPVYDGLAVVRMIKRKLLPLVAFITAFDEYAIRAFDANAIDYLLKPIDPARLRRALMRAHERLERADARADDSERLRAVADDFDPTAAELALTSPMPALGTPLRRIPVRRRDDILIVPVDQIAAVVADGELLHLTMISGERHTITYRLKDLEARLDTQQFVRLSRGTLAAVELIQTVSPMPGGTYLVTLKNRLQLPVSRMRARALRELLLTL